SATAAANASDARIPIQKLPYGTLREELLKDAQVLDSTGPGPEPSVARPALPGILLDDRDAERTGEWKDGNITGDVRIGDGYVHDNNENKGALRLVWKPPPPNAGDYEVIFHYVPHENRARAVPVIVRADGLENTYLVDEKERSGARSLGTVALGPDSTATLELSTKDTEGYVVADGVQLLPVKRAGPRGA